MDQRRRDLLKLGAGAVGGALVGAPGGALAQERKTAAVASVPPLAGKVGLRVATCRLRGNETPTLALVLDDGRVLDLGAEAKRQRVRLDFAADSMLSFIASGDRGLAQAKALADKAGPARPGALHVSQVQLLSPIPRPDRNIYCVGWNYLEHFEEGREARADKGVTKLPDNPVFFTKGTHTMNGPFDAIPYDPSFTQSADWPCLVSIASPVFLRCFFVFSCSPKRNTNEMPKTLKLKKT